MDLKGVDLNEDDSFAGCLVFFFLYIYCDFFFFQLKKHYRFERRLPDGIFINGFCFFCLNFKSTGNNSKNMEIVQIFVDK